ncbi:MAG: hypothetical protein WDM88_01850 [Galbitalea sp.]
MQAGELRDETSRNVACVSQRTGNANASTACEILHDWRVVKRHREFGRFLRQVPVFGYALALIGQLERNAARHIAKTEAKRKKRLVLRSACPHQRSPRFDVVHHIRERWRFTESGSELDDMDVVDRAGDRVHGRNEVGRGDAPLPPDLHAIVDIGRQHEHGRQADEDQRQRRVGEREQRRTDDERGHESDDGQALRFAALGKVRRDEFRSGIVRVKAG